MEGNLSAHWTGDEGRYIPAMASGSVGITSSSSTGSSSGSSSESDSSIWGAEALGGACGQGREIIKGDTKGLSRWLSADSRGFLSGKNTDLSLRNLLEAWHLIIRVNFIHFGGRFEGFRLRGEWIKVGGSETWITIEASNECSTKASPPTTCTYIRKVRRGYGRRTSGCYLLLGDNLRCHLPDVVLEKGQLGGVEESWVCLQCEGYDTG